MEESLLARVSQAKSGDKEALIELIMSQKQDYYRLAYVYLKNKEDALDVLSEMIIKLYENIQKLRNEERFFSWSKSILVNCCKQSLRKKYKVLLLNNLPEEPYEEAYHSKEERIVLDHHLEKLSFKYQEVLKLRYYLDMDYETIAAVLKIPIGTVKSRIHTGLKKLKVSMEVNNYE